MAATDLERLLVRLEANASQFEKNMARATAQADRQTKAIEARFAGLNKTIQGHMDAAGANVARGMAAIAGALSAKVVLDYADQWQSAFNKIRATGLTDTETSAARDAVLGIADRARTSLGPTADLYARLSRASQSFGSTQGEVAVATEVVSKALKISGASAQETESTLIQLGQALTSGRLQGDELRSLGENAPIVAAAIAKAFGVTVGELKTLGAEGKLTSDKVFRALVDAQPEVEKAFATTSATIADAFSALQNAAIRFVGASGQTNTAIRATSSAASLLAQNFDVAANGALALGAVIAARMVAGGLAPVIASFGATSAAAISAGASVGIYGAAVTAAASASTVAALAARALGGALALVGGPVGAALLGIVSVLTYVSAKSTEGIDVNKRYAAAMQEVDAASGRAASSIRGVGDAASKANADLTAAANDKLSRVLQTIGRDAKKVETDLRGLIANIERFGAVRVSSGDKEAALAALRQALTGSAEDALKAKAEIERLGAVNPSFASAFSAFGAVLSALAQIRTAAANTRAELAGVAASQDAAERKRVENLIPNPTTPDRAGMKGFDIDARAVLNDPTVRAAIGQNIANRAKIDAEMDETKKKIRDKRKEIIDEILAKGGTVPGNIDSIAKNVVAAESSGGGGKATKEDGFAKALKDVRQRTELQNLENQLVGKTSEEVAKAKTAYELLTAAKAANKTVTADLLASIDKEAQSYAAAEQAVRAHQDELKKTQELQSFIGTSISSFFSDVVSGGKNASDAMMNFAKRLSDVALQAVLLGQGPLAGLFKTAPEPGSGTNVGGLIGELFKSFAPGRATGGPVRAGQAYTVGENGRETFVPTTPGTILPAGGRGGVNVQIVNQNGSQVGVQKAQGPQGPTLKVMITEAVNNHLARGGADRVLGRRYGMGTMG